MRNFLVVIFLLSPGLLAPLKAQQALDLETCVTFALTNYHDVDNARLEIDKAKARVSEIIADGLPQINGSINYSYNPEIQVTPLPDFISPSVYQVLAQEELINPGRIPNQFGVVPAQFGVAHSAVGNLTLKQLLFDGTFFLGLKAAKVYTQLSEKQLVQTKTEVVANVTKSYYAVLINQERLSLANANVVRLDTLLRQTRAMYENGFSEKIDADRIEVAYNNALSQRNTLRRTITNSESVLKFQMGMPLEEPIEITEKLVEHEDLLKEKMQKEANFNYANRIEYDILNTQRELAELDQRRIQSIYLPDLYFNANYGANTFGAELGEIGGEIFTFSSIGLSTSIPIFDGFRKKYQIAQRKIEVKQIEVARRQLENRINLEQEQNLNNLDNALETLGAQERNMELAQEIYRISKIKYQEGVGSVVELVDAEGAYKEAETNYYAALFDAILAKVDYEKATGLLFREN